MNYHTEIWDVLSSSALMPDDAKIDSPIERVFYRCFRYIELGLPERNTLVLKCQVPFGRYRADFAIFDADGRMLLVVECDGHDFHDGSKASARRDRERDRWFASQGMPVFRFTGSEIYASPFGVAVEAWIFVRSKLREAQCQPG